MVNQLHTLKSIKAKEILDSRGKSTLEVEIIIDKSKGKAAVPSGASTGTHEALELRDSDGSVNTAVSNVNNIISKKIIDKKLNQKSLDKLLINLDGTKNKSKLGANAILGVSLAFAQAASKAENIELYKYLNKISGKKEKPILPIPMLNILNGGRHAQNGLDIQEFMILPIGKSFKESMQLGKKVFLSLGKLLNEKGLGTNLADEGGYAPLLESNEQALELITEAIKLAGLVPGKDILLAIDAAASEFYKNGKYYLKEDNKNLSREELITLYSDWIEKYHLVSIEDPLEQEDFLGYAIITKKLGKKIKIVGDDLFVTHKDRLKLGIYKKSANSVLIKLNQVGTVSETLEVIKIAKKAKYECIVSHRSGETLDSSIADLAVALGINYIKSGAPSQPERVSKYNRLIEIEKKLGKKAIYAGDKND